MSNKNGLRYRVLCSSFPKAMEMETDCPCDVPKKRNREYIDQRLTKMSKQEAQPHCSHKRNREDSPNREHKRTRDEDSNSEHKRYCVVQ